VVERGARCCAVCNVHGLSTPATRRAARAWSDSHTPHAPAPWPPSGPGL
jgi:hypothetical protein